MTIAGLNRRSAAKVALVLAAFTITAASAHAGTPYAFTAIDFSRSGADVVDGQYEAAINRINRKTDADRSFSDNTNLCIAYAQSHDVASAISYCDRAVEIARAGNGMPRVANWVSSAGRGARNLDLAIALSNRSVAHIINGDHDLAASDLSEAKELRVRFPAVSLNLSALSQAKAR